MVGAELTLSQLNGRFKLLPLPTVAPAKCAVCGAVNKPVIDFGLDIDWYGVVYFCVDCIKSVADLVGMVDGEKLTRAELVQRHHQDQLLRGEEIVDEFVMAFGMLHDNFINRLRGAGTVTPAKDPEVPDSTDGKESGTSTENANSLGDERSASVSSSKRNGSSRNVFDIPDSGNE